MNSPKKYIVVDVRSNGKYPWESSMLSLGACIVDGNFENTFYSELKPIGNEEYSEEVSADYFEKGSKGLIGLKGREKEYIRKRNGKKRFDPLRASDILKETGKHAFKVMPKFRKWILENTIGFTPILAASEMKKEGVFVSYYFDKYDNHHGPFGYNSEDINSFYKGFEKNHNTNIRMLIAPAKRKKPLNALESAVLEAKEFWKILVESKYSLKPTS